MKNKIKYYLTIFLSFIMFNYFSIGAFCVQTPSGQPNFENVETVSFLEDVDWRELASAVFSLKGIVKPSLVGTASGFIEYDVNHNNKLEQHGTIGIRNNSDGTKTYNIPQELRQEIFNYVNNNLPELSYKEAYIYSYSYLNPDTFSNYNFYKATQDFIKQADGICICQGNVTGSRMRSVTISVIPRSANYAFIGNVNSGIFSNVSLARNWDNSSSAVSGLQHWLINENGTVTSNYTQNVWVSNVNNGATVNNTVINTLFTNLSKNELVYVFPTINAYKHYNSATPQDYYLRSDWSDTVSPNDFINSDDMIGYGNSYSEVVNNISSGMSPEQVIKLVDTILKNTSGGNGSGSSSDNNQSKWWERIGNAIGNLIDGLVDVLTKVIEKLSDALLSIIHLLTGYTDDGGTYHAGLFDKLTDLVDSGFSSFISSMFSWLPDEIVTLLTATLVFGIFFGIFKMLRR